MTAPDLHAEVAARLSAANQRYLSNRRMLVEALEAATHPLSIPELADSLAEPVPISTIYRNLTILCESGVARRLNATDDAGRYELDEELSGHHHHHLLCIECGRVIDAPASPRLERSLAEATDAVAAEAGFEVLDHRIDLLGRCADCRTIN